MNTICTQVQAKMSGKWFYAEYSTFSLDSESNQYAINISGYVGNAGDSLADKNLNSNFYLNGMQFTTMDRDNDQNLVLNCGAIYGAGWWYNSCLYSCLTCKIGSFDFVWSSLNYVSDEPNAFLRAARMMIRSN